MLGQKGQKLCNYSDASFAAKFDNSSQLGHNIFLVDKTKICQPILLSSYKSKKSVRSVMENELIAFVDNFDIVFTVRHDLKFSSGHEILPTVMTNSLGLFDVLTKWV